MYIQFRYHSGSGLLLLLHVNVSVRIFDIAQKETQVSNTLLSLCFLMFGGQHLTFSHRKLTGLNFLLEYIFSLTKYPITKASFHPEHQYLSSGSRSRSHELVCIFATVIDLTSTHIYFCICLPITL